MVDVIDEMERKTMEKAGTFVPAPTHEKVYWLNLPSGMHAATSIEVYLLQRIEQLEKRVAELEKSNGREQQGE